MKNSIVVRSTLAALLLAAIGFGMLTGLLEAAVHSIRRHALGETVYFGRDFFWTLPVADASIFVVAALVLLAAGAGLPRLKGPRVALGIFAGLTSFALMLLTERIHVAAGAFLAAAVGVAVSRLASNGEALRRVIRAVVPAAAMVLASAAAMCLRCGESRPACSAVISRSRTAATVSRACSTARTGIPTPVRRSRNRG